MKHGRRPLRQLRNTKQPCRGHFGFFELQEQFLPKEECCAQEMSPATIGRWSERQESHSLEFDRRIVKRKVTPLCFALVCRLLSQETYLLPYQQYIFSFANSITLRRYLSSITPLQRQAISKLMLTPTWGLYTFNYSSTKALTGWTITNIAAYPTPASIAGHPARLPLKINELQKHWSNHHPSEFGQSDKASYAIELVYYEDLRDEAEWVACEYNGCKILMSDQNFQHKS